MIWIIFTKALKNTIQIKNVKYYSFFKIADMLSSKKLNTRATVSLIRERTQYKSN